MVESSKADSVDVYAEQDPHTQKTVRTGRFFGGERRVEKDCRDFCLWEIETHRFQAVSAINPYSVPSL